MEAVYFYIPRMVSIIIISLSDKTFTNILYSVILSAIFNIFVVLRNMKIIL